MPSDRSSKSGFNRFPVLLLFTSFVSGHFLSVWGFQSSFRFDNFTINHGLSHNIVTRIVQDREGFLWFGTEDGLNRYDGYSFRVYKNIPGDTTSLRSSWIRALFAGKDGSLWVGGSGLDRYDPLTDSFIRYELGTTPEFRDAGGFVNSISEDAEGTVWAGTTFGVYRLQPERRSFRHVAYDPSDRKPLSSNPAYSILIGPDGLLWVGTGTGVDRIDPRTETIQRLSDHSAIDAGVAGKPVIGIFRDRKDNLWFCLRDYGLLRFDRASGTTRRYHAKAKAEYRLGSDLPFQVTQDAEGRIWIAHLLGLDLLDASGVKVRTFQHEPGDRSSLSGSRVYAVHSDRANGLWVGTAGAGVNRFDSQRNKFGLFTGSSSSNSPYMVFSVVQLNDGTVWIGSTRGLERFDPATASATPALTVYPRLGIQGNNDPLALFQDRDGFLWVGYRNQNDLERIDPRTGAVRRYPLRDVRAIFQDRDGEMWVGFWFRGVARLNASTGRYRIFRDSPHADSLHGGGVWAFYEDPAGRIWMGTWAGGGRLNLYDKSTGKFSRLIQKDEAEFKTGIDVRAIQVGPDGSVWLGTWGNGLQRFDPRSGTFEYFHEHQGLANNFVKGMVFDGSGNLWIGTERGLSVYRSATGRFRNYSPDDGLQGDLFLSGSAFRGPGGTLFFGGEQGLNFFHPDSVKDDMVPPPVVITKFRIFEKEQPPSFWRETVAELDHGQDFISFEFVGLDYTSPLRNRYAYMLEGFDKDWVEAGSRRYAAYTHLDGGEYVFRVRASNSDGVWNTGGASIRFRINPPVWKTWWFMPGVVLMFAAITFAGFRLWFRHQLALERLRQRIASDLHDDVGTELSSIVLGSQVLAKTLPLGEFERSQIEKLGAAARNTHEMMRDIVWVLRSDNDTLEDLNLKMREVADRLLAGRIHVFRAPRTSPPVRFHPETKRNLFLFYKEALNNIVRHSGATSIEISMMSLDDSVELVITDNGGGFRESVVGTGTGLRNLRARAAAMRATVSIESDPGGTRIYLRTSPT